MTPVKTLLLAVVLSASAGAGLKVMAGAGVRVTRDVQPVGEALPGPGATDSV
jgi:hypothetical protein